MIVFLIAVGFLAGAIAGIAYGKYLSKPVYVPEGAKHNMVTHPNHIHDHDLVKK